MDGWVKLNTDAAFCEGWGCASAEQAEEACLEGLRLVADWVQQPTCLESDCSNLIRDVQLKVNPRAPAMQRSGR
jgi:hypothetical protein